MFLAYLTSAIVLFESVCHYSEVCVAAKESIPTEKRSTGTGCFCQPEAPLACSSDRSAFMFGPLKVIAMKLRAPRFSLLICEGNLSAYVNLSHPLAAFVTLFIAANRKIFIVNVFLHQQLHNEAIGLAKVSILLPMYLIK